MIPTISNDDFEESQDVVPLTVYPSAYAYSAFSDRYDETPIDNLIRLYYLTLPDFSTLQ